MAIVNLNTIKNWFRTGLKPNQAQFWDTWDSFRHKNDKIPVGEIDGINELIAGISSNAIYKPGQLLIFKRLPNVNNSILESGDSVMGIVEGFLITGNYIGGNPAILASFDVATQF
jgi:hypothetical protein